MQRTRALYRNGGMMMGWHGMARLDVRESEAWYSEAAQCQQEWLPSEPTILGQSVHGREARGKAAATVALVALNRSSDRLR
jgi:hypothetical protein